MKKMKKLASLILAVVMVLSMTVAAFADDPVNNATTKGNGEFSITLTGKYAGHTYSAYQIFKGDLLENNVVDGIAKGDKVLSNIEWGSGVDITKSSELITALKAIEVNGENNVKVYPFNLGENEELNAGKVAEILGGEEYKNKDSELAIEFAKVMGKYLSSVKKDAEQSQDPDEDGKYTYTISELQAGYYLVRDTGNIANGEANTQYIMEVVSNVNAEVKADAPTIDKKITNTTNVSNDGKTNNVSIGEVVNYEVTSKVPAMDGYDKYFFIVKDTLSKGLTFNYDVVVTIDNKEINKDNYSVTPSKSENGEVKDPTNDTEIEIVFNNFLQYNTKEYVGKDIKITYSATLNENAKVGIEGNPNTVKLQYSNNPNVENKPGDNPNKPEPSTPTGETPESTTYTYVTGLELIKIDEATKAALSGAVFTISGIATNHKVIVYDAVYTEDPDGTYYKLNDGSYTTVAPNTSENGNSDSYADVNKKYVKTTTKVGDTITVTEKISATGTVQNGALQFEGLGAGKYTITEITAPNGYNLLDAPIDIEIEWEAPKDLKTSQDCQWTIKDDKGKVLNGIVQVTIENKSGALLPSTGGIGTTIFYAVGIILMAGAVFFVVRRKRA